MAAFQAIPRSTLSLISPLSLSRNDNLTDLRLHIPNAITNAIATGSEMKQTEDYLDSEFQKMSVQEQREALHDLYASKGADVEPLEERFPYNEKDTLALSKFQRELQQGSFPVYEMALDQNPAYVANPSFRLRFLRANQQNVRKAVHQMENFLRHKANYFGMDKLAYEITLEDFTADETSLMLSGFLHIQDGRDRAGRVVVYLLNNMVETSNCSPESVMRVMYYICFKKILRIPGVKEQGITAIYYDQSSLGHKTPTMPGLHSVFKVADFFNALPIQIKALHLCLQTVPESLHGQNQILGFLMKTIPKETRARTKIHYGSHKELQDGLKRQHGIPDTFPVDVTGATRKHILNVWFHLNMARDPSYLKTMNRYLVKEEEEDNEGSEDFETDVSSISMEEDKRVLHQHPVGRFASVSATRQIIHNPNPAAARPQMSKDIIKDKDVYLGRGRDIQNYPGNVRFREFLAAYHNDYDAAPRHERGRIATRLTDSLRALGVRFHQRHPSTKEWEECGATIVEKKVGQLLREFRKKKNKQQKNSIS